MTHQHQPPRLLDQVRNAIRARHYSIRTEEAYLQWVRRFIYYHGKQHPKDLGETHVNQFLSHLAVKRRVAASTQNQALCALVFLYRHVLQKELGEFGDIVRAKRPVRLPEVLTREEIKRLMTHMDGIYKLMAGLMYGAGLRLMETVRLRVKDVDFGYNRITVRDGKGGKDRYVPLAQGCRELLAVYLEQHTPAPWLFTAKLRSGPCPGGTVQKAFRAALHKTDIDKPASVHTLRHSYATHLLENGIDIRLIQAALGHKHPSTTMVYAHLTSKSVVAYSKVVDAIMQSL